MALAGAGLTPTMSDAWHHHAEYHWPRIYRYRVADAGLRLRRNRYPASRCGRSQNSGTAWIGLKQECKRLGNPQMPEQASGAHNALADARHNKMLAEVLAETERV